MSRLIVYAGAIGAGKSSLRAGGTDAVDVEIDPDSIARRINTTNLRAVDIAAGKEALRLFDVTLAKGRFLSLETTLTGRSVLGRIQAAKNAGYEVVLRYVVLKDPEKNIRRVAARAAGGGEPSGMSGRSCMAWVHPAGRGSPPRSPSVMALLRVHPRGCGEPERITKKGVVSRVHSAGAGEPTSSAASWRPCRVHPRGCGEVWPRS